jgi:hypothetical protein
MSKLFWYVVGWLRFDVRAVLQVPHGGIRALKLFCLPHGVFVDQEAGRRQVVKQTLSSAISGGGHRLHTG